MKAEATRQLRCAGGVALILAMVAVSCASGPVVITELPATARQGDDRELSSSEMVETPSAVEEPAESEAAAVPTPQPDVQLQTPVDDAFDSPQEWDEPFLIDPDVVQGEFANGVRYLVKRNTSPGGQAQLRLVFDVGSVVEGDDQLGGAHYLEHMMFNGTERFPGNELVQVLESFGSAFGADINAYTTYEETVYSLEVPSSPESVELGLEIFEQWATAATLASSAVDEERGVVLAEVQARTENVGGRLGELTRGVLLEGTEYQNRLPIGSESSVTALTADSLRSLYQDWYRPDRMTVVVVGDIDVTEVESQIEQIFADIAKRDGEQPPAVGAPTDLAAPVFDVWDDPELLKTEIQVGWRVDNAAPGTPNELRERFVRSLGVGMVNSRLGEDTLRGEGPFPSAGAGTSLLAANLGYLWLNGEVTPADAEIGLAALATQLEQLRQYRPGQAEFERIVGSLRSQIDQELAESDSVQDGAVAQTLVEYALRGVRPTPAEDRHRLATQVLDSIRPVDLQGFADELLNSNPYVLLLAPTAQVADLASAQDLEQVWSESVGQRVAERVESQNELVALMQRPDAVEVIDITPLDAIGVTVVTYANGARLGIRYSDITDNVFELKGTSDGGFFAEDEAVAPMLQFTASAVVGSGFATIDPVTVTRYLSDRVVALNASVGRADESVSGSASTDDLETLFQLLHLVFTEPTIDPVVADRMIENWRPLAADPSARPDLAATLALWSLRYGDSPWYRLVPTTEDLDAFDAELQLEAWKRRFADAADFDFAIVGDFQDINDVIDLGARYIGTLPAAAGDEAAVERDPGLPDENLLATVEAGVGEDARLIINWESPYEVTARSEILAEVLQVIVDARLRDLIREELGAAYAPSAVVYVLEEPVPWVDSTIDIAVDPDRIDEVAAAVRSELERLRNGEFDPSYLGNAIDVIAERNNFVTNGDRLDEALLYMRHPERDGDVELRNRLPTLQGVTVDDIASTAQVAFPAQRSVEVRLVPAG